MDTATRERLQRFAVTRKSQDFEWDFLAGVDRYETWDAIEIGESSVAARTYTVAEEDVVLFNRSAMETDPMFVDPDYARARGGLVVHPCFVVQIGFYCIDTGIGSWCRSPGARNPGQHIEIHDDFRIGETITLTITHWDKWIRGRSYFMQDKHEYHNEDGVLKCEWWPQLLLPPTGADVAHFARA